MQSAPDVPVRTSLFDVPMILCDPTGQHESSSASVAVTACVAVTCAPSAAVARQVTTVRPRGKCAGALLVMLTIALHASAATGVPSATPTHEVVARGGGTKVNDGLVAAI